MSKRPIDMLVKKLILEGKLLLEQDEIDVDLLSAAIENMNYSQDLVDKLKNEFKNSTLQFIKMIAEKGGVCEIPCRNVIAVMTLNGRKYVDLLVSATEVTEETDPQLFSFLRTMFEHIVNGVFRDMCVEIHMRLLYSMPDDEKSYLSIGSGGQITRIDDYTEMMNDDASFVFEIPRTELKNTLKLIANAVMFNHEKLFVWLSHSRMFELRPYSLHIDLFKEWDMDPDYEIGA